MSRSRDIANGSTHKAYAPLASPDFTGTVDLTGTTVSLDDDEIAVTKITGLSSAEYFHATGHSTNHQTLTASYDTVPLDQVVDEGGIYASGVFTPTGAGTYFLGGVLQVYDLDAGYTVYVKLTGAGSATSREFLEQCSVSNHIWQVPFSLLYTASSSSDTYTIESKLSSTDTGNAYIGRNNTHFSGHKIA